jgi:GH25 family lysozyme M1 (1,4-beta-N-acetylmuramidase)
MANENLAFGIDISRYNTSPDGKQKVDFDRMDQHTPKVSFISMRAGISWGYQDPWFSYYFQEAARIKTPRMPYHVLYPGENPTAQMDHFFRILGEVDFNKIMLVLDLELDHGQSKSTITRAVIDSVKIISERTGKSPILYSRAGWVNQFLQVADLPHVFWWLAQYRFSLPYPLYTPEYPSPPTLPKGVAEWTFHQTSCRGKSIAAPGAYYMDYNRFNGDESALEQFFNVEVAQPIICPVDGEICCRIFKNER